MSRWLRTLVPIAVLGLCVSCASATPDGEEHQWVARLVAHCYDKLARHPELRGRPLEQLTDDERATLRRMLRELKTDRAGLASGYKRLAPNAAHTHALATFLARWPEETLEQGLLASPRERDGLDTDLRALRRHFPEAVHWSPLRPLFRP